MSLLGNFGKYEGAPTSGDTLLGKLGNAAWKLNSDPNWQMLQARQRGEDPYAGQLMQMRQQQMQQQNTLMQQKAEEQRQQRQKMEAFMQSPEFQQLDPLSRQYIQATGDMSAMKDVIEQRQGNEGRQILTAFGQNPTSLGKTAAEQYSNLIASGVDQATAKNAVAMANPKDGQGGGLGQYNPRDYTTESWSKFIESNSPSDLVRYETPDNMPNYVGQAALEAATKADKAFMDSRRYSSLANDLLAAAPTIPSGKRGAAAEWLKSVTGNEDITSMLRKQYQGVRVSSAINNLPPGVASDKDIELVMSETLDTYANPEILSSYLRGLAKAQRIEGEYNQFYADYLYKNGSALGLNQSWRDYAERNANKWGITPAGEQQSSGGNAGLTDAARQELERRRGR